MCGHKNKKRTWVKLLCKLNHQGVTLFISKANTKRQPTPKGGREKDVTRTLNNHVHCLTVQKVWHITLFGAFILGQCLML